MLIFGSGLYTPRYKKALEILILTSGIIACISPVVRFSTLDYLRYGTADLTCEHTLLQILLPYSVARLY